MRHPSPGSDSPTLNHRRDVQHPPVAARHAVPADLLAARLAEDMAAAWRQGGRPRLEDYLARHAELAASPPSALLLLEEECRLRRAAGETFDEAELDARFPQWRPELRALCARLDRPAEAGTCFPEAGATLGDLRLLAELGRGARGRVFVALQSDLGDRPVVLKVTARAGDEHLALARLQHTHVVPLYWVRDFPAHDLRGLAMPYLGGATLKQLLDDLAPLSFRTRTGADLAAALQRQPAVVPVTPTGAGPARQFLARASYVQAVCWIGACLADALQYAHERGLLHLDLKPSNVLLSADGQPMLLDFHLARGPLEPGDPVPAWFGATPGYASPEQWQAFRATEASGPVPARVDGRADIYSLGVLLYELLGGINPPAGEPSRPALRLCNPLVSVGLADVIDKCLAPDPAGRYADAGRLAADLRRHLADQPLRGVANRSLAERWGKWRRRRPYDLPVLVLGLLIALATLVVGWLVEDRVGRHRQEAEAALADARRPGQDPAEAVRLLETGLKVARDAPGNDELAARLEAALHAARQTLAADRLHRLVERLRFMVDPQALPLRRVRPLAARCREAWATRSLIRERLTDAAAGLSQDMRADLLDLAVVLADLEIRLAEPGARESAHRCALALLDEARTWLGPTPALDREEQRHAAALGLADRAELVGRRAAAHPPRTAWEHYALGRSRLRAGDLAGAHAAFRRAIAAEPQRFWPHFYAGVCSQRLGQPRAALQDFDICVALAPRAAECFANRALARAALGQTKEALNDSARALEIKPDLAGAALNRGILYYQLRDYDRALADLRRARENGADPAAVYYNLAVVYLAQDNRAAALSSVRKALQYREDLPEARALLARLTGAH